MAGGSYFRQRNMEGFIQISVIIVCALLCSYTVMSSYNSAVEFYQCQDENIGIWWSFQIWMGIMEEPKSCPITTDIVKEICWNALWLLVSMSLVKGITTAVVAYIKKYIFPKKSGSCEKTESLQLMTNAYQQRGEVIFIRETATREETIRLNPRTRKFELLMWFPKEEVNAGEGTA